MPFKHTDKQAGDLFRSADWNALGTEVVRLETDKLNRAGTETMDGPLTVRGAMTVGAASGGGTLSVRGDLSVGTQNAGAAVRVLKKQEDGRELAHGALVLGTDAPTSAALRLGYSSTYSWLQGQGQQTLAINPYGGDVGIGTTTPRSRLAVGGGAAVGADYAGTAAPANGLIVQGRVGVGVTNPGAPLHVNGDTIWSTTPGQRFLLHVRQNGTGEWVQLTVDNAAGDWEWAKGISLRRDTGNVGVGTTSPEARLHVAGGDLRLDAHREIFFADNGQIRSLDNSHRILFRRSENVMELRESGRIVLSSGATEGVETARVTLTAAGQLAIGTTTPRRTLHVEGHEIHSGGNMAGFSFNNRETAAFSIGSEAGERWVWFSSGKVARLWAGGDRLLLAADGTLTVTGRLVTKSGREWRSATNRLDITARNWIDMPGMTLTIPTTGNAVLLLFKAGGVVSTGAIGHFRMLVNGTQVCFTRQDFPGGTQIRDVSLHAMLSPGAGSHEVKIQCWAEGGTLICSHHSDERTLIAVEL